MKMMTLLKILQLAELSPESFGKRIGISGMTIRRWTKKSKKFVIPSVYVPAIRQGCYLLAAETGNPTLELEIQSVVAEGYQVFHSAALKNFGLEEGFNPLAPNSEAEVLQCLTSIGLQTEKKIEVDKNEQKLSSLKLMGKDWESRISKLWSIIRSQKLENIEKLVAYGALFYLVTPIDFIPDYMPFFGYMDDFLVLGIAVSYYGCKPTKKSASQD